VDNNNDNRDSKTLLIFRFSFTFSIFQESAADSISCVCARLFVWFLQQITFNFPDLSKHDYNTTLLETRSLYFNSVLPTKTTWRLNKLLKRHQRYRTCRGLYNGIICTKTCRKAAKQFIFLTGLCVQTETFQRRKTIKFFRNLLFTCNNSMNIYDISGFHGCEHEACGLSNKLRPWKSQTNACRLCSSLQSLHYNNVNNISLGLSEFWP
jgi:hypothetical protein